MYVKPIWYFSPGRRDVRAPAGSLHGDHEAEHRRLRGTARQAVRRQEQPHRRAMNSHRPPPTTYHHHPSPRRIDIQRVPYLKF